MGVCIIHIYVYVVCMSVTVVHSGYVEVKITANCNKNDIYSTERTHYSCTYIIHICSNSITDTGTMWRKKKRRITQIYMAQTVIELNKYTYCITIDLWMELNLNEWPTSINLCHSAYHYMFNSLHTHLNWLLLFFYFLVHRFVLNDFRFIELQFLSMDDAWKRGIV